MGGYSKTMGKTQPDYVTKSDLRQSMKELYKDLRKDLRADARKDRLEDMHVLLDQQTEQFRDELNSKLYALETRLMAHTEDVVGNHSVELLENIASVIDPKGTGLKGRKYPRFHRT